MCSERLVTSVTPEVSGCSGGVTYGVTSRSEHDRYPAYWRELTSSMSSAVSSPVSGQQSAAGFSYRRTSLDGFLRAHNARCISVTCQRSKQWMWNKVTDISCYWFVSNSAKRRVNNYTVTASTTEWEFRQIALRLSKLLWKPYSVFCFKGSFRRPAVDKAGYCSRVRTLTHAYAAVDRSISWDALFSFDR